MLEIDADGGGERLVERVAAIDVAKASAVVCTRLPHAAVAGRRVTRVWEVRSTTNAIIALAEQLAEERIERVVVESTSDYWRPFVYLLEARGLTVWLVNASEVKQVPGRPKTDKLDAVWLAKLNERGMLRRSFVPPAEIRRLRDYTRLRVDLVADRTRQVQRLEKLLEDAPIKLSTVVSDILGVSGRAMIDALIAGERDPHALAELARGSLRGKRAALVEALTGRFDDHHAELAQMLLDEIDALTTKTDTLTLRIDQLIADIPAAQAPTVHSGPGGQPGQPGSEPLPAVARLDEITGIGLTAAHVIVAEVGLDMTQFPTPAHLISWTRLCPRTIQSGPKNRHGKAGKGNPYLRRVLGEAAIAASKTDTFLGERYRRLVRRRGKLKALVAVARSILTIVWHLLANPTARYRDLGAHHYNTHIDRQRKTRQLVRQLEALGHTVTLEAAPLAA
jgi:transposase